MNRKECLKIMVRCVAFVVVFSMLFGNATDLLMRHDDESNEIHAFYSEPEDTALRAMSARRHCRHPLLAMDFWRSR